MHQKSGRRICFILVLFLLFSGMCLESVQVDSSFACTVVDNSISYLSSYEVTISETKVNAAELVGVRNPSYVEQLANRSICNRKTEKVSMEFLRIEEEIQSFSNLFAATNQVQLSKSYGRAAVINYIHNQDGKKRI